ncbi:excinuclease ABC subunit UvrC [Marinospirillum alkaliphilum]|uniref:UvrABC system protein C n=1 Tax=Marinospirillum alkaliphilum DSM 21637 TaxID=1122209 RepID=A0A1K1XPQ8_9GAMM|nr:excinuclease ABC subunit UvrC [Marinospirillum alkaliphilum]SFX51053.1 Excinuclease ABC subunit C [Marinospirillum alkaliphilum DSM 21637]
MSDIEGFDHRSFLKQAPQDPGIYQMFAEDGKILYVGKARNLRNRLASYFRSNNQPPKTRALVSRIASIEVTITRTETEALLLEQNLIKALKPPFNILLRDDKSYPFLHFSDHAWPALGVRRTRHQRGPGQWFGPYPSASMVRETLQLLYRVFQIRQCDDTTFSNRSRPCLQYQIKRCSAPCTGEITAEAYAEDLHHARLLLEGKSQQVTQQLAERMDAAAAALDFEQAAHYRDQIQQLRQLQVQQDVDTGIGDADVFALVSSEGQSSISLLQIRQGRLIATRHFNFTNPLDADDSNTLTAFVAQFYLTRTALPPAPEILLSHELEDQDTLQQALAERFGIKSRLAHRVRSQRARWLELALTNAGQQLTGSRDKQNQQQQRMQALQQALELEQPIQRMECFDISHSQGEATVASCVVFDADGPRKQDYRRFNIEGITGGDDYAAMAQALERRYRRVKAGEVQTPDLLLVDGGKGQLNAAREILENLGLNTIRLLGVAKGTTRKPGLETLFIETVDQQLSLPGHSPALHLIQQIRDEAHRFAITGHRQRRDKARQTSFLEGIAGVGPKRRQALLRHFGGRAAVAEASIEALCQVEGINRALAEEIHATLHNR